MLDEDDEAWEDEGLVVAGVETDAVSGEAGDYRTISRGQVSGDKMCIEIIGLR